MNLRRFPRRIGLRESMGVIAVVALGLGSWRLCQDRRERFHQAAVRHEVQTAQARARLSSVDPLRSPTQLEHLRAEVAYCSALAAKYHRAAQVPWWIVGPDPPPPDP